MKIEFPNVNNKLAFFDCDRLMIAHDYSEEYIRAREGSYFMECVYCLTSLESEHAGDRPLPCVQWYAKKLQDEGYGLYCLTHEVFNLRDRLKQEQLKKFYKDTPMTYLTVDSPEHKIDMMMAVAMVEKCDLKDVIFVDDRMATIYLALAAGIDAKHLSDIVVMYENRDKVNGQPDAELKISGNADKTDDMPSANKDDVLGATDDNLYDKELERIVREHRKERDMADAYIQKEVLVC